MEKELIFTKNIIATFTKIHIKLKTDGIGDCVLEKLNLKRYLKIFLYYKDNTLALYFSS